MSGRVIKLNIIVCIKQVPSTNDIKIDPVSFTLIRDNVSQIVNPADESALETALSIKDKMNTNVSIISMGKTSAMSVLKEALSVGADNAYLINDKSYAGSDTYATSIVLSHAVQHIGDTDLIVCGSRSLDGETGQVGPELAVVLDIPCVTNVTEVIEVTESFLEVKKQTDEGYEMLRVALPALICVNEGSQDLRPAGIISIREAKNKELTLIDNSVLKVESEKIGINGSPTKVRKVYVPKPDKKNIRISEDSDEIRKTLVGLIEEKMNTNE